MNFICENCQKVFSVKGVEANRLMSSTTQRVCSPECAAELLSKEQR